MEIKEEEVNEKNIRTSIVIQAVHSYILDT